MRRAILISIALSGDDLGVRLKAIEKLIIADKNFSIDQMMEFIKAEVTQYYELRPKESPPQPPKDRNINMVSEKEKGKGKGLCYAFAEVGGCSRAECRFEHRLPTKKEKEASKARKDSRAKTDDKDMWCLKCGVKGHRRGHDSCLVKGNVKFILRAGEPYRRRLREEEA